MKNQLKKIIHCVLITLILQSQVLSVQAAQVKFDENKKFSAVWRDNVAPTVSKSFTTAGTNMGVIGNFNPDTGRFDEYWQTCDVVVNFTAEDNVGITGYYLGKTNPLVSQVTWSDVAPSKTMATQKRIGLNGENPLYSADPSGTYYFAVRDAAGNIGVSTVEAQFTWVRGAANYSTGWKSIPNTNGYTYFAISYNHRKKGYLTTSLYLQEKDLYVIRIQDIPDDWSEISLQIRKEDANALKLYTNKRAVDTTDKIEDLTYAQYMIEQQNGIIEGYEQMIEALNKQIEEEQQTIENCKSEIEELKESEKYQTAQEQKNTEQLIAKANSQIGTSNSNIDNYKDQIEEYKERIKNARLQIEQYE